ncbi:hypothetical protein HanRHA438_Chr04g0191031 [Helianthus annuus]|nr:hypothetical protein HanHA300_Chr04g0148221 [Helianthus annuus]KAJ0590226.1 hypothetical protein HanIR_Chr04g0195021 [Helianthus annuus]KAJ0598060.1 hypothetical protein HanHA89_Chr04g0161611 [Helianthus annuus]KAJ0762358.1 hypothetical protein HanOQP8_Chr04g0160441 [Helianthus annuus]KAJ0928169.1 hypothetical protein HanRHA438_Chr04g0191031 [Helianthus annuus]
MRWRFKDQTMSFDLGEDFVFDQRLARALIEHKSPIRPLHEHFLLLGRLCFQWSQRDRDWPVIRRKSDRTTMSLLDALKVAPSAQEIRPILPQDVQEHIAAEITSSVPQGVTDQSATEATSLPLSPKGGAGSSGSQAGKKSILDDVDSDPEVRSLDEALCYRPSSASLKSKGIDDKAKKQTPPRKRKTESLTIRSADDLSMPKLKKGKQSSSHSGGDVMVELDEHLTGGKFSREEAALARTKPTPVFSGGFLPVNEVEGMHVENPEVSSKGAKKTPGEHKVVTFSGTTLGSSLGPDYFVGEEEDQVSSHPPSWFGPELMSFFRYADVFSDDMEIDPATAEDKFVPDWDIRNKDSVMDELVARTFLFNIGTPINHARSQKMKSKDLGAAVLSNQAQSNIFVTELYRRWVESESVREDLEKEMRSLKRKIHKAPEMEKKVAQLTTELQTHQEKIKSLMVQNQSSQAAAASAAEERDRVSTELKKFSESMRKQDEEHKSVMAKMEESFNNARLAYANMMAGEAELKAQIEETKCNHDAEVDGIKKENIALKASVDDLLVTKTWLLSEGARLLAKNIHKGREMTAVVAAVNNAMSAVGVNSGLHNGYLHALKLKTPYSAVPLLNRNAAEELSTAVACFDSLTFPVVEDLPKLIDAPLSKIKEALTFANSESLEK